MVLGLIIDLTIVNHQAHSSRARFSHKETRATVARVVPVFLFLDKASIFTFLGLALNHVDLFLWGGVRTPSYHRPFELWFQFEVHLDEPFTRQEWGQLQKPPGIFR